MLQVHQDTQVRGAVSAFLLSISSLGSWQPGAFVTLGKILSLAVNPVLPLRGGRELLLTGGVVPPSPPPSAQSS